MAALAASAVSDYPALGTGPNELYPFGKGSRDFILRRLKLVLTGQGGQTNTIGAAALGFSQMLFCSNLVDITNSKGYPAAVDPTTNTIILFDGAAAPAPVDVTSTATYITVVGTPTL